MNQNMGAFPVWRSFECLNLQETNMVKITISASCTKNNSGIFGDYTQQYC